MPISPADIASLKQRIKSDIEAHKAKITDLEAEYKATELVERRVQAEAPEQQLLPLPKRKIAVSFAQAVRDAVKEFKNETFTVANVEAMLKAQGATLPQNHLRTRIAVEVKDMARKGAVVLVEKGSGHTPHKYRNTVRPLENERPLSRPRGQSLQQH